MNDMRQVLQTDPDLRRKLADMQTASVCRLSHLDSLLIVSPPASRWMIFCSPSWIWRSRLTMKSAPSSAAPVRHFRHCGSLLWPQFSRIAVLVGREQRRRQYERGFGIDIGVPREDLRTWDGLKKEFNECMSVWLLSCVIDQCRRDGPARRDSRDFATPRGQNRRTR